MTKHVEYKIDISLIKPIRVPKIKATTKLRMYNQEKHNNLMKIVVKFRYFYREIITFFFYN